MRKACGALLVLLVTLAAGAGAFARPASNPDVTVLVGRALGVLHGQAAYKKAVFLQAAGVPARRGAKVRTAAGITRWQLVFDNQSTPNYTAASVVVNVVNGKLGKPTSPPGPFTEDRRMNPPPKMTLAKAISLLRAAHYRKAFANVSLLWPLAPGNKEPLYIFGFGIGAKQQNVSVGTRTHKVKKY